MKTSSQQKFLESVELGQNIFLTGKAGTGKSYIVKAAIKLLQEKGKNVVALAPTGVAANNIGGQTIHSMFNINPFGVSDFENCNFLRQEKRRIINKIDVIFIDEISMLRPDVLDAISWTMKKNGCKGLESRQIIFIGDLKQLPSPMNDNTRSVLFMMYDGEEFFHSKVYKKLNVQEIELTEVVRQSDPDFVCALNKIRDGGKDDYFKRFVSEKAKGIVLAPHNTTVEKYNTQGLEAAKGPIFTFESIVEGNVKGEDFNVPSTIQVKQGCKIMYLANSNNGELVNGTIGIFVSHQGCHFIRVGNIDYALQPIKFTKKEYILDPVDEVLKLSEIGSITQFPFRLAFALSIHKSQGLTFDEVTVDLSRPCFQKGQMYVALSRVKNPEGLSIIIK